jgi:hypothetical protein
MFYKIKYPNDVSGQNNSGYPRNHIELKSNESFGPPQISNRPDVKNVVHEDIKNYILYRKDDVNYERINNSETFDKSVNKIKKKEYDKLKKFKEPTMKDYDELDPDIAIQLDKRPFFRLFFDFLVSENSLFELIFKRSIIEPLWIRIVMFIYNLSIMFAMSALLYSDDMVDSKSDKDPEESVIIYNSE